MPGLDEVCHAVSQCFLSPFNMSCTFCSLWGVPSALDESHRCSLVLQESLQASSECTLPLPRVLLDNSNSNCD